MERAQALQALTGNRRFSMGVDSCAATSAIPATSCDDYPLRTTSTTGQVYSTATEEPVAERGTRAVLAKVADHLRAFNLKAINGITKARLSVHDLVQTGHRVTFDDDRSVAVHKTTGQVVPFINKTLFTVI